MENSFVRGIVEWSIKQSRHSSIKKRRLGCVVFTYFWTFETRRGRRARMERNKKRKSKKIAFFSYRCNYRGSPSLSTSNNNPTKLR